MYLKELTLKGFKSFASATTLRFEPGITAVVGPNGSGKSNIVDALAWVMGEQGARNLRGTSMEDVIFAGTSSRPALGRAQVSLTIDNTDRALDIDYTEVTISRTLFRNGGSQYAINGSPCRLLDIQELLSDTGLGSQMHVIVGQGQLDRILHADPAGHRAFIEEAAGIIKHRRRKERALRKLAATERNLTRLDDLLGEIHRQLGPLGRQARISRRADGIHVIMRDAQARLHADDATRLINRRTQVREELTGVRSELTSAQRELADVKIQIERAEEQSRRTSPAIARLDETWHEMSQLQERFSALASLAGERRRSLLSRIVTDTGQDPDLLLARADELAGQAREQHRTTAEAKTTLDEVTRQRADEERRLASLRHTAAELRDSARKRETQVAELNAMIAREEALELACRTRRQDAETQHAVLIAQLDDAKRIRQELEQEAAGHVDADDEALTAALKEQDDAKAVVSALAERSRAIETRIVALQAKADALADTLESRSASDELARTDEAGVLGRLAEFVQVRDGWDQAVARALGAYAEALVVPSGQHLLHALELARERHLGKAVLLSAGTDATPIADKADTAAEADILDEDRCAASLIRIADGADGTDGTAAHANAIAGNTDRSMAEAVVRSVRALLADTAIAHSAEEAQRLTADGPWRRAVTASGELFCAGVAASGGSALVQSDLSLTARRQRTMEETARLRTELDDVNRQLQKARRTAEDAADRVQRERTEATERRMRAERAEAALRDAAARVDGLTGQIDALEGRIRDIDEERAEHRTTLDDLHDTMTQAERHDQDGIDFDELAAREQETESALAAARDREVNARLQWTESTRTEQSLERQIAMLRDNARQAALHRERIRERNARYEAQAKTALTIADAARLAADDLSRRINEVESRRADERRAASAHGENLARLRGRRSEIEPILAALREREHTLDLERERLAASYDQLSRRISDDLGMTCDEVIGGYGPALPVPVLDDNGMPVPLSDEAGNDDEPEYRTVPYDRAEQAARLDKAKRDLARLGKVNPLATEEFEALQSRNRYLNDQRADVAKSREDLLTLIRRLDATMVDVFRRAFDDTAAAFETMFGVLFPGGQGSLVLENPDDPLASGVLVRARPAGKRVRRLSLLSGGERSLTALAFLLAIFTARPSPFYVMDEVEAALDDVNLTRLLGAFERLREHAQLIVITHQQRTMSIADALYGVTMRADGVTAVLSQRLADRPGVDRPASGDQTGDSDGDPAGDSDGGRTGDPPV
ncbi:chromosome segregation protein SMC [Bifidobacterium simiarum]|uniref:Chromosome partition protein Smc n=1 Tax=Bifidobacterium simiarum TaxID=2045441 RepID=A0A2M9HEF5_9BIFI|nr:chromosome segregation protein SMC [Bifidobacterium simiarum]PJM75182.1 chromosome segregation protein SMC [Bifidobacterium simiarum]